jgi:hypothetical protein
VFDAKTREPLGFGYRVLAGGDPTAEGLRIERFTRYESVAGIRVPIESEEVFIGGGASGAVQRIERTITIDPPLGPKDFQRSDKMP